VGFDGGRKKKISLSKNERRKKKKSVDRSMFAGEVRNLHAPKEKKGGTEDFSTHNGREKGKEKPLMTSDRY